jgi:hypothetical protein
MIDQYDMYLFTCSDASEFQQKMLDFEDIDINPILKKVYGSEDIQELYEKAIPDEDIIFQVLTELPKIYHYVTSQENFAVYKTDLEGMFLDLKQLFPEYLNDKYYHKLVAMKV